jgi:hypothetical protein
MDANHCQAVKFPQDGFIVSLPFAHEGILVPAFLA